MLLQFFHYLGVDNIWVGFEELEHLVQGGAIPGKALGIHRASLDFSSPLRGVIWNRLVFGSPNLLSLGAHFYEARSRLLQGFHDGFLAAG